MRLPATAKWIGLALLGLAIAVAVAIAASNLASQQIGIASESISAGEELAPAVSGAKAGGDRPRKGGGEPTAPSDTTSAEPTTTEPTTATETTEPVEPTEPGDDHGGGDGDGGEDD